MYKKLFLILLFSSSCIFSMDYVSSSITPSSSEPLTFEQQQKNDDELAEQARSRVENWRLEKTFKIKDLKNYFIDIKQILKNGFKNSFATIDTSSNYSFNMFDLGKGKLALLIWNSNLRLIKILDINSGKYLFEINGLETKKGINWYVTKLCKLPGDRFACVINTKINDHGKGPKKIKIFDTNSGKLLKEFVFELNHVFYNYLHTEQMFYLGDEKLVLLICDNENFSFEYLVVLDLKTGSVLLKLPQKLDIFGTGKAETEKPSSGLALTDGNILLKSNRNNLCILDPATCKVIWKSNGLLRDENEKPLIFKKTRIDVGVGNGFVETDESEVIQPKTYEFNFIVSYPDNKFLVRDTNGNLVIFRNEKFNFGKIKEVLNDTVIPVLQKIIFDYLSDQWEVETRKFGAATTVYYYLDSDICLFNKKKLLFYHYNRKELDIKKICPIVLYLDTSELVSIDIKGNYNEGIILDDGRVVFDFDKHIEIWSNQPEVEEDDLRDSGACVIC